MMSVLILRLVYTHSRAYVHSSHPGYSISSSDIRVLSALVLAEMKEVI